MTKESLGQASFIPATAERVPFETMHSGTCSNMPDLASAYNDFAVKHDADYDADTEVVKPYEIEEPDDDVPDQAPPPKSPKLLEEADQWQGDLVRSLRQLHCESDTNDTSTKLNRKRGQKRKPSTNSTAIDHAARPQSTGARGNLGAESPKRLRRRSRRSSENIRSSILRRYSSTSRGTSPWTTNSSTRESTPATSEVHRCDAAVGATDEMDIDPNEVGP